jgi:hypothetical protein
MPEGTYIFQAIAWIVTLQLCPSHGKRQKKSVRHFESWPSRETTKPCDLLHFAVPNVEWLERFCATCRRPCTVLHLVTRHNGIGLCGFPTSTIPFFNGSYWNVPDVAS